MTIEEQKRLTENLTALNDAITLGAKEVYYGDKRVVYRSLDEMLRIRDDLKNQLGIGNNKNRIRYGSFSKGIR